MKRLFCLFAAALLLLATACGGGDDTEPAADEGDDAATEETEEASTELEFVGTEFAFAGPESAPAGELTITFTNNGEQEHEMGVIPLKEGALPVEDLIKLPEKKIQKYAAGPFGGTEGPIKPGETKTFTIDTTDAASVGFACFVTDPKTKKPHAFLGMFGSFEVES